MAERPPRGGGAVFAPRSLGRPPRRPPFVPALLMVAIGALVVVGTAQQLVAPRVGPSTAAPSAFVIASTGPSAPSLETHGPRPSSGPAELIRLDARPDGRHLFVHGEVFSLRVFLVIVSVRDNERETLDIRTLDMPGGSTAFRIGSVNRFEVRFDLPDPEATRFVTIQASGYDEAGDRILSADIRVGIAQG